MIIAVNLNIREVTTDGRSGDPSFYNKELINGIIGFAAARTDVELWFVDRVFSPMGDPDRVDGIIGAKSRYKVAKATPSTPIVNVTSTEIPKVRQVCCDDSLLVRLAFEHFHERNLRNFAYLHIPGFENSESRKHAFAERCRERGFFSHVVQSPMHPSAMFTDATLRDGLKSLPKPAGLLLLEDRLAPDVLRLCEDMGIRVPQDLAVLGVNNVAELCLACSPSLSSVDIDVRRIGHMAASTLVELIEGREVSLVQHVPPRELVARESTMTQKGLSPSVSKVIDFMHANLLEPIVMEDLVHEQGLGRRALEKAFHAEIGEAPMHYLRRLRLERVAFLLKTTDLNVSEISSQCGFRNTNYLCRVFKQAYRTTPHAYRKRG